MAKEFAFESGKVSIAFGLRYGLGDAVVAKKVFDAFIEIEPNCRIDIFYNEAQHRAFAKAFFGGSKNLNRIFNREKFYEKHVAEYDLAVWVVGTHYVTFDGANVKRLQTKSPKLLQTAVQIYLYNDQNVHKFKEPGFVVPIRNVYLSRILNKNFFWFLSCGGALPIRDEQVDIKLSPTHRHAFDKLKLVKKSRPDIAIIQCGGECDICIENVDRHFLGCDLELTKYILANSLLHVGCEGGLVHLATALGTKCMVFFGVSDWHYYGYEKNINLASTVCEPCMYVLPSGTVCVRGEENPPCMLDITPQEAFDVTCEYLQNNA